MRFANPAWRPGLARNQEPGKPAAGASPFRIGLWAAAWLLLSGCSAPRMGINCLTPDYQAQNVFQYTRGLAPDVKRLALLPLGCEDRRPDLREACQNLNPLLRQELIKTRNFEVVSVSPETLRLCSGHPAWTGTEMLPQHFFDSLRETCGCDVVMFSELTLFRAYKPLAVGLRMRLVDARTGQTLWAVDEVLDAGRPDVANGSGHYQVADLQGSDPAVGSWLIRNSPREFSQYAAAEVLATLPKR